MSDPPRESAEHAELIRNELARVCRSRIFLKSIAASRLLAYLVEQDLAGRSNELKEYTVAVELFGATANYDPKIDSLVRVNANRLRARLVEYYASGPPAGPVRIHLEKGAYAPSYQWASQGGAICVAATDRAEPATGEVDLVEPDAGIVEIPAAEPAAFELPAPPSAKRPVPLSIRIGLVVSVALAIASIVRFFPTGGHPAPPDATPFGHVEAFASSVNFGQFAEFSHDGKAVVFIAQPHGETGTAVYSQAIDADIPRRLTLAAEDPARPAWSPDGTQVAYLRLQHGDSKQLVVRTLATGAEAVVASLRGGPLWLCSIPHLSWAPDGTKLYTSASEAAGRPCGIVSIDLASQQVRPIIPAPSGIYGDLEPAVAPDGRQIAFMRNYGATRSDVFVADLVTGSLRQMTHDTADVLGLAWEPQGKALVVSSNRGDGKRRLWRLPLEGGAPEALTDGPSEPSFPSIGAPEGRIIFTEFRRVSGIWRADGNGARNIVDNGSSNMGPEISVRGKLLFTSERSGRRALWISDDDGQNAHRVVREDSGGGRWSPDGRQIVFECQRNGNQICLTDPEGREFRTITEGKANHTSPAWSSDGTQIFFTDDVSGMKEIYRKTLATGVTEGLTNGGADLGEPSRDGRWLYYRRPSSLTGIEAKALVEDPQGAAAVAARLAALAKYELFFWQVNGDQIVFVEPAHPGGVPLLTVFQPDDGNFHRSFPLPSYNAADLPGFSFSDGEQAAYYARSQYRAELKILEPRGSGALHE